MNVINWTNKKIGRFYRFSTRLLLSAMSCVIGVGMPTMALAQGQTNTQAQEQATDIIWYHFESAPQPSFKEHDTSQADITETHQNSAQLKVEAQQLQSHKNTLTLSKVEGQSLAKKSAFNHSSNYQFQAQTAFWLKAEEVLTLEKNATINYSNTQIKSHRMTWQKDEGILRGEKEVELLLTSDMMQNTSKADLFWYDLNQGLLTLKNKTHSTISQYPNHP